MRVETPATRTEILWTRFQRYAEPNQLALVAWSKKSFSAVPKRAISEDHFAAFEKPFKRKLPTRT
jgi:hypothetical protein